MINYEEGKKEGKIFPHAKIDAHFFDLFQEFIKKSSRDSLKNPSRAHMRI